MEKNFIPGRFSLLTIASQALLALGALTMASTASALVGQTALYSFNLPAISSYIPPYPVIAVVELEETTAGVKFTITPNQPACTDTTVTPPLPAGCNPGFTTPEHTRIKTLELAFANITSVSNPVGFTFVGPLDPGFDPVNAPVENITLLNNANLDSSYTSSAQAIRINFFNPGSDNHANATNRFYVERTSMFTMTGVTIDQFTSVQATSTSNKPTPVFGVMSLASFTGDSSNWVAEAGMPMMVPEPTNLALLGIGLIGFVLARRRHA